MLVWAVIFLCLGLIAVVFGFRVIKRTAFCIAKALFFIFIAFFVASLILQIL